MYYNKTVRPVCADCKKVERKAGGRMNTILQTLKQEMIDRGYKCVAGKGEGVLFSSHKNGIAPLLDLYEAQLGGEGGLCICDRVFGKAAVFVAYLCGARDCYAFVASRPALDLAAELGMRLDCETEVPFIENRDKTGQCPIENSVMDCSTPEEALAAIRRRLAALRG